MPHSATHVSRILGRSFQQRPHWASTPGYRAQPACQMIKTKGRLPYPRLTFATAQWRAHSERMAVSVAAADVFIQGDPRMKRFILTLIASTALAAGAASADGNWSLVEQFGIGNAQGTMQNGDYNGAYTGQFGGQIGGHGVPGGFNGSLTMQEGVANFSATNQVGGGNLSITDQFGAFNDAATMQLGTGHESETIQHGIGNMSLTVQSN
jgi:hypothetical protein